MTPRQAAWQARVECGREVGAGLLVSGRHVVTCAHVVQHAANEPVYVEFPLVGGLEGLSARVVCGGGWTAGGDRGDIAVLELPADVPQDPVEFAPPGAGPGQRLLVYGFPDCYDDGIIAEYRTTGGPLIAGEWEQLEAYRGHGQPLAPGFSGAAVVLADSGRAVGMVTEADEAVRNGRMLPAAVMARYWPELGDLVPTEGHGRVERRELRRLVERAEAAGVGCGPAQLFARAVDPVTGPALPPGGFRSLAAVAWYVLAEVDDPAAPARLTRHLAEQLGGREHDALRRRLRRWAGPGAPPDAAAPRAPGDWSPIVVELTPSGEGPRWQRVAVSAYRDGQRRPVGEATLPRREARARAVELIDEAFHELPYGARVLISFVLPTQALNEPVAEWPRGADDPSPLGCFYPLVVMDRPRRGSGSRQHDLRRKWTTLEPGAGAPLFRVACGSREDQGKLTVRLSGERMLAFASPPRGGTARTTPLKAGLNASVPVIMWPRTGCAGGHDGAADCAGSTFLDSLGDFVHDLSPTELPEHILELRREIMLTPDPGSHWAKDLTLLWEDPRCFPTALGHAGSPVG
ncbi:trypsin-like peptidase domain-containing protein [Streptomyces sp. NPDC050560]|uniref:VMAP-C domain-containing protein n=1 Tax=Streptomyces sp. NPDC050560 TaxID=3365630 RepID=UPI00379C9CCE